MADYAHKETDRLIEEMERKIKREYRQAVKEVQDKLDDYLRRFEAKDKKWLAMVESGKKTAKEYAAWREQQIMVGAKWEAMKNSLAAELHEANVMARSIVTAGLPEAYAVNHAYATYLIEKSGAVDTAYTIFNRDAVERLMKDDPDLLKPPGESMKTKLAQNKDIAWQKGQIQSVTLQSILQGESIPNMAKRIAQTMGETNHAATIRYARTAMTAAENAGRQDAFIRAEEMGVKMKREWIATLDDRTRHEHRILDGQKRGVNEPFEAEGYEIMYPGDPAADPEMIWNCRCTLQAVVDGWEDMSGKLRSYEDIDGMTYEEWKEAKQKTQDNGVDIDKVVQNAKEFSPEEHEEKQRSKVALEILPDEEQRAIEKYSGTSFTQINGALREQKQEEISPRVQAEIDRLTSAINKFEIKDDTILYRGGFSSKTGASIFGVDTDEFKKMLSDGSIVGQTFMDKGFCSTSVTPNIPLPKEINLRIFAPAGTKGAYIDPISEGINEKEMLLQRGTTFEVVNSWIQDIRGRGKYTRQFLDVVIIKQP